MAAAQGGPLPDNSLTDLVFDEGPHIYRRNGRVLISVTQAIHEGTDLMDHLTRSPIALERGRLVHRICEWHDLGILEPESVDPELAGYHESYRAFLAQTGFQVELNEFRSFHPIYNYAGTLDRTGFFPKFGRRPNLIDIKSGIYEQWHRLQTAAYANFLPNPNLYLRWSLLLSADGSEGKLRQHPPEKFQADWAAFLGAVNLAYWKRGG